MYDDWISFAYLGKARNNVGNFCRRGDLGEDWLESLEVT
jgi:hypothetical protein